MTKELSKKYRDNAMRIVDDIANLIEIKDGGSGWKVKKHCDEVFEEVLADIGEPQEQLAVALKKLRDRKSITVYFSEEDLQDLLNGEEFNWTFDGVDVKLVNGEEEE